LPSWWLKDAPPAWISAAGVTGVIGTEVEIVELVDVAVFRMGRGARLTQSGAESGADAILVRGGVGKSV
jgi:hypothetical protein